MADRPSVSIALPHRRRQSAWLRYLWAGPTTLIGFVVALFAWCSGGRAARVGGVLEVWGGLARRLLQCRLVQARAMTLGHVVLGRDMAALKQTRGHERVHVRQAERWGPLFIPAYLGASAWAWIRWRHYYRDNWFEVDAERRAAARESRGSTGA